MMKKAKMVVGILAGFIGIVAIGCKIHNAITSYGGKQWSRGYNDGHDAAYTRGRVDALYDAWQNGIISAEQCAGAKISACIMARGIIRRKELYANWKANWEDLDTKYEICTGDDSLYRLCWNSIKHILRLAQSGNH